MLENVVTEDGTPMCTTLLQVPLGHLYPPPLMHRSVRGGAAAAAPRL
jgi:hypothetical protein